MKSKQHQPIDVKYTICNTIVNAYYVIWCRALITEFKTDKNICTEIPLTISIPCIFLIKLKPNKNDQTYKNGSIDFVPICFYLRIRDRVIVQHGLQVRPVGREVGIQHTLDSLEQKTNTLVYTHSSEHYTCLNVCVRKLPSSQERASRPQLHSESRVDALGLTGPSAVTTESDGTVHSPDHHES